MGTEQKRWDDAAPEPLKYVMSDGTVLDSLPAAGEEITPNPNRALAKRWDDAAPVAAKWVNSDGAIVDKIPTPGQTDTPVIEATRATKKLWDETPAQVSKFLKSDGTVSDTSSSGPSADLEDNHETTIDVSTYTGSVEVTPTEGKDGMKKNTVTLSNIPTGKEEQAKSVTIRSNGTTQVTPDSGKTLSQVSITTNVQPATKLYAWMMFSQIGANTGFYTPDQTPVVGSIFLKPVTSNNALLLEKLTVTAVKTNKNLTLSDGSDEVARIGEQYDITI